MQFLFQRMWWGNEIIIRTYFPPGFGKKNQIIHNNYINGVFSRSIVTAIFLKNKWILNTWYTKNKKTKNLKQ